MTPIEFREKMEAVSQRVSDGNCYIEDVHIEADNLLCELLVSLGYDEGVKFFNRIQNQFPYNYIKFTE
jgi:hypothetical protein